MRFDHSIVHLLHIFKYSVGLGMYYNQLRTQSKASDLHVDSLFTGEPDCKPVDTSLPHDLDNTNAPVW